MIKVVEIDAADRGKALEVEIVFASPEELSGSVIVRFVRGASPTQVAEKLREAALYIESLR